MSIRKLDKDTLNKIMSNKSIDNVNEETIDFNDNYNLDENEILQEELDTLYELGLKEIEHEALMRRKAADEHNDDMLSSGGQYHYRKDGENHLWTPESMT